MRTTILLLVLCSPAVAEMVTYEARDSGTIDVNIPGLPPTADWEFYTRFSTDWNTIVFHNFSLYIDVPGWSPLTGREVDWAEGYPMILDIDFFGWFNLLNGKPHYPSHNIGFGPDFQYAHFANSGVVEANFTGPYHLSQAGEDGYVPHIEPLGNGVLFRADPELETHFGEERPYYNPYGDGTIASPTISTIATAVPEPSQWAMMVLTLIGCLGRLALRWKRPACLRASAAK